MPKIISKVLRMSRRLKHTAVIGRAHKKNLKALKNTLTNQNIMENTDFNIRTKKLAIIESIEIPQIFCT
jgi:hypothetical protein